MSPTEIWCLVVAAFGLGYVVGLHVGQLRCKTVLKLSFFKRRFGLFRRM
jgi:hypothetical protein